jgi:uncharacterized membrane protein YkvA (DUF1232 family)
MTYVLDPEDVIKDAMPYVGGMDDYFVTAAGLKLKSS